MKQTLGIGFSCLAALLAGCASPGVPRPPSLRLPEKASGLKAERVGAEVRLSWTTPANTTDGDANRGALAASVCRGTLQKACAPVRDQAVVAGASAMVDTLPGTLRVGTDSLMEYRVELKNDRGRSAGPSEPAFAVGGRAPEMPAGLAATAQRDGVLVTWEPEAGGAANAVVEVHRAPPAGTSAPAKTSKRPPVAFGGTKPTDGKVVLVADGAGAAQGMLDRSAKSGETYVYTAQRVRRVRVAGHALEIRSAESAPVAIAYAQVFPPQPPTGLATVPGGGFGSAPSVDLSWQTSEEAGVTGYHVYRTVDGGAAVRVTTAPVAAASYRDLQVSAGHTYGYRVTAVDRQGNESAPSAAALERLR